MYRNYAVWTATQVFQPEGGQPMSCDAPWPRNEYNNITPLLLAGGVLQQCLLTNQTCEHLEDSTVVF